MTPAAFRKYALSLEGAHEAPHFARASFRLGKAIFASLAERDGEAMVKVSSAARREELMKHHGETYFSYGGWTEKLGALGIRLANADAALVKELLSRAHADVAAKTGKRRPKK